MRAPPTMAPVSLLLLLLLLCTSAPVVSALAGDGATLTNAPLDVPKTGEPATVSVDDTGRSIIKLSPSCSSFEIAFRKSVGVTVSCAKPSMKPWTAPIKDYVIVRLNPGSQLIIAKSDDPVLGRLSFSALSQDTPQPLVTFAPQALEGLTSLARLFFDRIDFSERSVALTLSSRLTDLLFQFTNAEDVSISSVDPKTSSLSSVTLSYTDVKVLPGVLYERKYNPGFQVLGLTVVPKTQKIQKLNSVYYANAIENLKNVSKEGFNLTGDCSASTPELEKSRGVHVLVDDPSVRQLRISMQHLVVGKQISRGAFGVVHQGVYMERAVAVKRLTPVLRGDLEETSTFVAEAKLVSAMRHDRIIQFIGLAWDTPFDIHLVTEFMSGGDLRNVLAKLQQSNAPTGFNRMKIRIALHVVEALTYLHSLRPQVLHRDLKSRNVLLSTEMDAKLIDFGVSRKSADHTMTACVGTLRWMAPEVIQGGRYDERADVFSFGVVLSELDTHAVPYSQDGVPMPDGVVITKVSMGQLQASFSPHCDPAIVELARRCIAYKSSDRPTAEEVLARLRQIWLEFRGD
ncbi:hypothetical protein ATCC90586_000391 [Pythium insidiosum]|nr:hypothetical protein ATCC90586_000391 [Pythium insidiosum]